MSDVHVLPEGVYYRLRFLQRDAELAAVEAELAAVRAQAAASGRFVAFRAAMTEAAGAHGFDMAIDYAWDDRATALVAPQDAPPRATTSSVAPQT